MSLFLLTRTIQADPPGWLRVNAYDTNPSVTDAELAAVLDSLPVRFVTDELEFPVQAVAAQDAWTQLKKDVKARPLTSGEREILAMFKANPKILEVLEITGMMSKSSHYSWAIDNNNNVMNKILLEAVDAPGKVGVDLSHYWEIFLHEASHLRQMELAGKDPTLKAVSCGSAPTDLRCLYSELEATLSFANYDLDKVWSLVTRYYGGLNEYLSKYDLPQDMYIKVSNLTVAQAYRLVGALAGNEIGGATISLSSINAVITDIAARSYQGDTGTKVGATSWSPTPPALDINLKNYLRIGGPQIVNSDRELADWILSKISNSTEERYVGLSEFHLNQIKTDLIRLSDANTLPEYWRDVFQTIKNTGNIKIALDYKDTDPQSILRPVVVKEGNIYQVKVDRPDLIGYKRLSALENLVYRLAAVREDIVIGQNPSLSYLYANPPTQALHVVDNHPNALRALRALIFATGGDTTRAFQSATKTFAPGTVGGPVSWFDAVTGGMRVWGASAGAETLTDTLKIAVLDALAKKYPTFTLSEIGEQPNAATIRDQARKIVSDIIAKSTSPANTGAPTQSLATLASEERWLATMSRTLNQGPNAWIATGNNPTGDRYFTRGITGRVNSLDTDLRNSSGLQEAELLVKGVPSVLKRSVLFSAVESEIPKLVTDYADPYSFPFTVRGRAPAANIEVSGLGAGIGLMSNMQWEHIRDIGLITNQTYPYEWAMRYRDLISQAEQLGFQFQTGSRGQVFRQKLEGILAQARYGTGPIDFPSQGPLSNRTTIETQLRGLFGEYPLITGYQPPIDGVGRFNFALLEGPGQNPIIFDNLPAAARSTTTMGQIAAFALPGSTVTFVSAGGANGLAYNVKSWSDSLQTTSTYQEILQFGGARQATYYLDSAVNNYVAGSLNRALGGTLDSDLFPVLPETTFRWGNAIVQGVSVSYDLSRGTYNYNLSFSNPDPDLVRSYTADPVEPITATTARSYGYLESVRQMQVRANAGLGVLAFGFLGGAMNGAAEAAGSGLNVQDILMAAGRGGYYAAVDSHNLALAAIGAAAPSTVPLMGIVFSVASSVDLYKTYESWIPMTATDEKLKLTGQILSAPFMALGGIVTHFAENRHVFPELYNSERRIEWENQYPDPETRNLITFITNNTAPSSSYNPWTADSGNWGHVNRISQNVEFLATLNAAPLMELSYHPGTSDAIVQLQDYKNQMLGQLPIVLSTQSTQTASNYYSGQWETELVSSQVSEKQMVAELVNLANQGYKIPSYQETLVTGPTDRGPIVSALTYLQENVTLNRPGNPNYPMPISDELFGANLPTTLFTPSDYQFSLDGGSASNPSIDSYSQKLVDSYFSNTNGPSTAMAACRDGSNTCWISSGQLIINGTVTNIVASQQELDAILLGNVYANETKNWVVQKFEAEADFDTVTWIGNKLQSKLNKLKVKISRLGDKLSMLFLKLKSLLEQLFIFLKFMDASGCAENEDGSQNQSANCTVVNKEVGKLRKKIVKTSAKVETTSAKISLKTQKIHLLESQLRAQKEANSASILKDGSTTEIDTTKQTCQATIGNSVSRTFTTPKTEILGCLQTLRLCYSDASCNDRYNVCGWDQAQGTAAICGP